MFYLLPHKLKPAGLFIAAAGLIILIARFFFDYKPAFLNIKTFAVCSTYLQSRYFSIIENHVTEEIGGFLLMAGLFILIFVKEKDERDEFIVLRLKAFFFSYLIYSLYLILTILFVFGIAFIKTSLYGLILPQLCYLIFFNIKVSIFRRQHLSNEAA